MIIWIFHEYPNIHALWYSLKYTDKQILMRNLMQTNLTLRMPEYINSNYQKLSQNAIHITNNSPFWFVIYPWLTDHVFYFIAANTNVDME